jgi:hypothetical protein
MVSTLRFIADARGNRLLRVFSMAIHEKSKNDSKKSSRALYVTFSTLLQYLYLLTFTEIKFYNVDFAFLDDDEIGPIVLAWMLGSAIIMNFAIKLYDMAT